MALGDIAAAFRSTFRRYVTDGVPASGRHAPLKSEIYDAADVIEQRVANVEALATTAVRRLAPVRVATTANGTLASAFDNGSTVDGVVLATNDRLLLKDQTAGAVNGIVIVQASGAPVRATDADTAAEIGNGTVDVQEGTANAGKTFTCQQAAAAITLETTVLSFVEVANEASINPRLDTAEADILLRATIDSPALTGNPTAPTQSPGNNSTRLATTAYADAAVAAVIAAAPGALNTLDELAAALGDDANFATTVTNALATKAPINNPTLTGTVTIPTASAGDNSTKAASTAYVDTGLALKANLNSPTFTGSPAAPTPTQGDNDTSIATTAFVTTAVAVVADDLADLDEEAAPIVSFFSRQPPAGWDLAQVGADGRVQFGVDMQGHLQARTIGTAPAEWQQFIVTEGETRQ